MSERLFSRLRVFALAGAALAAGCAGFNAGSLRSGVSTLPQIEAALGAPAMVWKNPEGTQQLAYPLGPSGTQTFMVFVGADGKLQRITGVLNEAQFGLVRAGMTKEQVLRILGPSGALWTQTFPRTNTLAWTWLYCAPGNFQNYFNVMFDVGSGLVRSTGQSPVMLGREGLTPSCTPVVIGI